MSLVHSRWKFVYSIIGRTPLARSAVELERTTNIRRANEQRASCPLGEAFCSFTRSRFHDAAAPARREELSGAAENGVFTASDHPSAPAVHLRLGIDGRSANGREQQRPGSCFRYVVLAKWGKLAR